MADVSAHCIMSRQMLVTVQCNAKIDSSSILALRLCIRLQIFDLEIDIFARYVTLQRNVYVVFCLKSAEYYTMER